jgi:hypothetical protein
MNMTMDLAPYPAMSIPMSNYTPNRLMFDPVSNLNTLAQQKQFLSMDPPIGQASRYLLESLEKRPIGPNGLQLNDRPIPRQLIEWQEKGGFWGRVAGYYINKHKGQATKYKSPFASMAQQAPTSSLAQRYYDTLEPNQKLLVDEYRSRAKTI